MTGRPCRWSLATRRWRTDVRSHLHAGQGSQFHPLHRGQRRARAIYSSKKRQRPYCTSGLFLGFHARRSIYCKLYNATDVTTPVKAVKRFIPVTAYGKATASAVLTPTIQ